MKENNLNTYMGAFLGTLVLVGTGLGFYFFAGNKVVGEISKYRISYYHYTMPSGLVSKDVSMLPPAESVPVLMYHGVTYKEDNENTSLENFINTMELLKKEGYETISVQEFDLFRKGKSTLPKKPILITFDDGRKDSYYTTDSVFEKLGYKATLFLASGPVYTGNTFYLNNSELAVLRDSGRWEIQAHGRHSHDHIQISENSNDEFGRFLSSKMYIVPERRLETDDEFLNRIKKDYEEGDEDVEAINGSKPKYFAIPLNDYGEFPVSNYPESIALNNEIVKNRYELAFIQSNDTDAVSKIISTPYNFQKGNPYKIRRLEVKNLSAQEIINILDYTKPGSIEYVLDGVALSRIPDAHLSGTMTHEQEGFDLTADEVGLNGLFVVGEEFWKDYSVYSLFTNFGTRSVSVVGRYKDEKNYVMCGKDIHGFFIRELVDGKIISRGENLSRSNPIEEKFTITLSFDGQYATCASNKKNIFSEIYITQREGFAGMKIWDDVKNANIVINDFKIWE
ncbi:MAG: polysaccharide deacetylase family protein [Candidatus Pacebacteria bacterium]|jgi:peptidoglycan/xylan/chitin deacetylase (PgdA/CDA1 family)|nr:polysaccharide deacetylase family protein [Candidatus Paceibacterota bacterium]MBP9780694.1 polysaccharide deacetylase family protein [Candidatus Paceibacterota bacterium]MDQ5962187.1 hypothetical protein [Patescibacteria group bacterium]